MPTLLFQLITITADLVIFAFIGMYFFELRDKKKEVEKKESKIDTGYHQVVDSALTKERKILDDATKEANEIITGAHYINKTTKDTVDQALQKIAADIHKAAVASAEDFMGKYQSTLKQVATTSLTDFTSVSKTLEDDWQKQIQEFHKTLLPGVEKEVEAYKQARLQNDEQLIARVVQKV